MPVILGQKWFCRLTLSPTVVMAEEAGGPHLCHGVCLLCAAQNLKPIGGGGKARIKHTGSASGASHEVIVNM